MLLIEGVTKISSHKDTLVLETESGIDIALKKDAGPNYIDIESYVADNGQDLIITMAVRWDDSNLPKGK